MTASRPPGRTGAGAASSGRLAVGATQRVAALVLALTAGCAPMPPRPSVSATENLAMPDAPLVNTYWKLVELDGATVPPPPDRPDSAREAHLVLHADGRLAGSDGCNRLMGRYALDGGKLSFGEIAATRMACAGLDGADARFQAALAAVQGWQVQGDTLALWADGRAVARLKAVALR